MLKMEFPCEIVANKILPSVKCELAKTLKKKGVTQRKIAQYLNLTEAAVSQYLSGKRAKDYKIPEKIKPMFELVAKAIFKKQSKDVMVFGISEICKAIRKLENIDFKC